MQLSGGAAHTVECVSHLWALSHPRSLTIFTPRAHLTPVSVSVTLMDTPISNELILASILI